MKLNVEQTYLGTTSFVLSAIKWINFYLKSKALGDQNLDKGKWYAV